MSTTLSRFTITHSRTFGIQFALSCTFSRRRHRLLDSLRPIINQVNTSPTVSRFRPVSIHPPPLSPNAQLQRERRTS
ncbi:hypothetical protein M405DRAFT_868691 [Rhizopogon salebrosus TDB-379]|nr:hypothetical protein M405DRAFT_868691 [Rhizopogon salebrosus TDB-379]